MSDKNWYKADNVAKLFLASYTKRDTRTIRVSCTLDSDINPELLGSALLNTIKERPEFQVRIRRGFFWHYIEPCNQLPFIKEEDGTICQLLYGESYKGILHYQVTYYKNRINLEIFHVLCDGTGALSFLNTLVFHYMKLAYPDSFSDALLCTHSSSEDREQDSFDQFYKDLPDSKETPDAHKGSAYSIGSRRLPYNQLQHFELHMDASSVLNLAHSCKASVTSLLSGALMLAIYKDMPARKRRKRISISLPVNLRGLYGSDTSRNFFNNVNISHTMKGNETLGELAMLFDASLKSNIQPGKIKNQVYGFTKFENLIIAKLIPLFIKQPLLRLFSKMGDRNVTAAVSSLGLVKPPNELMNDHILYYSAFCSFNGLFTTISSFKDELVMGMSSAYASTSIIRNFIRILKENNIEISLYASDVIK